MKKVSIFGVSYSIADYNSATQLILENATAHKSFSVTALNVHGLMESVNDRELMTLVNKIDLIVPDGQPVRWAMNSFYNAGLADRVAGPQLTLAVLQKAHELILNVYLYGSKKQTLNKLVEFIQHKFPSVNIVGVHEDRFREATDIEDAEDIQKINDSNAHIVLVGRGCPRQERWVAKHNGKINAAMLAVGAAFDFHAGTVKQAPVWMQKRGLEWVYRICKEPRRLWKRYLTTNSQFIILYIKHFLKFNK